MLQNFRDNLKGIGAIIAGIIAIPFVFTGVDNFFLSGSAVEEAASVNGEKISEYDVLRGIELQKQQLRSQYGDSVLQFLSDEMLRGQVLNQLIQQKAIQIAAKDAGLGVAQESINESLMQTEAFQVDGKFDADSFTIALQNVGLTPNRYLAQVKGDFLTGQMLQGVMASDFVTNSEVASSVAIAEQQRTFYYLTLPIEPALAAQEVTDEQLQERYESVKDQLIVPEQVVVNYIELSLQGLADQQTVTDEQIKERFDTELESVKDRAKQQRLAHILIASDNADADQIVADIQQQLAQGADFAKLAEQYSEDLGTASQGGDLGYIDPSVLPDALASAAVDLAVGQVSGPLTSDMGTHILTVTEEQTEPLPTLEEQSDRIAEQLKLEQAQELYASKLEELKDSVFSAESLQEPATELGLTVETSEPFGRAGGEGVASYPELVKAVYTDEVLKSGYASEVVELGDSLAIVAKLKQRTPERVKALGEVRDELADDLKREAAEFALETQVKALLAKIKAGESVESVAKANDLEWQVAVGAKRSAGTADAEALQAAFQMPVPAGGSVVESIAKNSGDQLIVELTKVEFPTIESVPQPQLKALTRNLLATTAQRATTAYQQWLVDQAEIDNP